MQKLLDIVYSSADPAVCKLDVFLPDNAPNGRAILFIHGGGWQNGNKAAWHGPMEYCCARGYVCGSATYHFAPAYKFPRQVEDVRTAMAFFKDRAGDYGFDARRVATWGSSAGGHLAAMLATIADEDDLGVTPQMNRRDTRPAAAVCYCTVMTCHPYEAPNENLPKMFRDFLGEAEVQDPAVLRRASPLDRVRGGEPPFFMIVGDVDKTTPVAQHEEMRARLQATGGRAELVVLPGAGHGFGYGVKTEHQQRAVQEAERFLASALA